MQKVVLVTKENEMRVPGIIVGILIVLTGIGGIIYMIGQTVYADYIFEKNYMYAWNLSDKASTIEAKAKYINEFVTCIESNRSEFASHAVVFLKTPNNSFNCNLDAIKTLRDRLETIKTMKENSFEYQSAIQQITAQEQGQAHELISIFESCYILQSFPMIWEWKGFLWFIGFITLICVGIGVVRSSWVAGHKNRFSRY
jgi:hypothetical protein